jgi:lipooligosaccharide transport system permease protein
MMWGATRSLISSTIVLGVVAAFGLIASPLALLVPVVAFFSGLMFSAIAMVFTSLAPNIDFFNYPGFLYITPMFLLSGTFFPITQLPAPVQTFARALLPLPHVVTLTRGLVLGNLEQSMLISLAWIAIVTPLFFILSINLMRRKLIK